MNPFTRTYAHWLGAALLVASIALAYTHLSAHAQTAATPEFMVTWQAENYAPADFMGKLLPINKTPVEIVFNLLQDGKILDLSKTEVRWYINDKLQISGAGKQVTRFMAPELATEDQEIRIDIPSYKGKELIKTLTIPMTSPQVVIQAPYLVNQISYGATELKALPYFFNVTDLYKLDLHWFINEAEPQSADPISTPNELTLQTTKDIPLGTKTEVKVSIQNQKNATEIAGQSLFFTVVQ